jgi:hypothetical protein
MSVCNNCSSSDKTVQFMAVQISSRVPIVITGYGCKNSILPLVSSVCAWRGSCLTVRITFQMKHTTPSAPNYRLPIDITAKISNLTQSWSVTELQTAIKHVHVTCRCWFRLLGSRSSSSIVFPPIRLRASPQLTPSTYNMMHHVTYALPQGAGSRGILHRCAIRIDFYPRARNKTNIRRILPPSAVTTTALTDFS